MKELKERLNSLAVELSALGEEYDSVKAVHGLGSSIAEAMWSEYMKLSAAFYSTLSLCMILDKMELEIAALDGNGGIQLN
jgi:hypothetical protein